MDVEKVEFGNWLLASQGCQGDFSKVVTMVHHGGALVQGEVRWCRVVVHCTVV